MSNGKGSRNRSASKKYWENYNDINWGKESSWLGGPSKRPVISEECSKAVRDVIDEALIKQTLAQHKEIKKLNCIASDKCQTNKEVKE